MSTVFKKTAITGGTSTALDGIDGNVLSDGDFAIVTVSGKAYLYQLNATSGVSEASPEIIAPDVNPGSKRWELQSAVGSMSKVVSGTWAANVSGSQTVTGVGFKPSSMVMLANVNGQDSMQSVGFDANLTGKSVVDSNIVVADSYWMHAFPCLLYYSVSAYTHCAVTSYNNDGVTLQWVGAGSVAALTINYSLLLFK